MGRRKVLLAMLGVVAAGVLSVLLGLVPIRASAGHWAATKWLLNFTMQRAVSMQSLGIEAPELDSPRLRLIGAGHYETACRMCHGAPGRPLPVVPHAAIPHPPDLKAAARDYAAEELFYIVLHGIKFTGMPAWPSQKREDEVWAMVAFLKTLPNLDADAYQRLVFGETKSAASDAGAPEIVQSVCARCHGAQGTGRGYEAFPVLAGQKRRYLERSLRAYAAGRRPSGVMQPIAVELSEQDILAAAAWYSSQTRPEPATQRATDPRGESIALKGISERKIPSCAACHGPAMHTAHETYPILDGQPSTYLRRQLMLFAQGERGGTEYATLMKHVAAHALLDREVEAVARFYSNR